jgi:hypothetical protein
MPVSTGTISRYVFNRKERDKNFGKKSWPVFQNQPAYKLLT